MRWEVAKFLSLLTLLLILTTVNAEICQIPENEGVYLVNFPTHFDLDCSSGTWALLGIDVSNGSCLAVIDAIGMNEIKPIDMRVYVTTASEEQKFGSSIAHFDAAAERYTAAEAIRESIYFQILEAYVEALNITTTLAPFAVGTGALLQYGSIKTALIGAGLPAAVIKGGILLPLVGFAVSGWVALWQYESQSNSLLKQLSETLKSSAHGMNEALLVLHSEAQELYCAGGGDEQYAGEAAAVYNKVREFVQLAGSTLGRKTDTQLPLRWSYLRRVAMDIEKENILEKRVPTFLNSIIGQQSVFPEIIAMWRSVNRAKVGLLAKYSEISSNVTSLLNAVQTARARMAEEKYDLIKQKDLLYFVEGEVITPSRALVSVDELLHGKGLEPGALQYISEAKDIFSAKGKFYATRAIEKLKFAQSKLALAQDIQKQTFAFVDDLLQKSAEIVNDRKIAVEAELAAFQMSDRYDADIFAAANKLFDEAKALMMTDGRKTGEIISRRARAMAKFDEISTMLSDISKYTEKLRREALYSAAKLNSTILNATKDEIYIEDEKILLENALALLSVTKNTTLLKDIKLGLDVAIENILLKASEKYSKLNTQRAELAQQIAILSEISDTSALRNSFERFEQYVDAGKFVPERTLGLYKVIENAYAQLAAQLALRRKEILQHYLPKRAKIEYVFGDVELGEKSDVFVTIEIFNDLLIGTNESIALRIPVSLPLDSMINTTSGIANVIVLPNALEIWFARIDPQRRYTLSASARQTIAEIVSESRRRVSLSTEKMVERIDIEFNSLYPLQRLAISVPCTFAEVYFNGVRALSSDRHYITGVRAGKNSLYAICTTYAPISIVREQFSVGADIEELLSVRSNVGLLENAELSVTITNASNPRLYDSAGVYVTGTIIQRYGTGYIVRWKVPLLTDSAQYFILKYTATNLSEYVQNVLAELRAAAAAENVSIASEEKSASHYLSYGNVEKALEILEGARRKIEAERNARVQRAAIEAELAAIASKIETLIAANLSVLGVEYELEANKLTASFGEAKSKIFSLLAQNKTTDALKELERIRKEISRTDLVKLLEKKVLSLWIALADAESTLRAAERFENVSTDILKISELKEKLLSMTKDLSVGAFNATVEALRTVELGVREVDARKAEIVEVAKRDINALKAALKALVNKWKNIRTITHRALQLSDDNPGQRPNTKGIEEKISTVDSKLAALDREVVLLNESAFDALDAAWQILNATSQDVQFIEKFVNNQKSAALTALSSTNELLEQRLKEAKTKEEIDNLQALRLHLAKAKRAFDAGNYLDALVYARWITQATQQTERKEETNYLLIGGIIGIMVAGIATVVYIIRMRRGSKLRKLRKIGSSDYASSSPHSSSSSSPNSPNSSSPHSSSPNSSSPHSSSSSSPSSSMRSFNQKI